jgi:hypothetical protein
MPKFIKNCSSRVELLQANGHTDNLADRRTDIMPKTARLTHIGMRLQIACIAQALHSRHIVWRRSDLYKLSEDVVQEKIDNNTETKLH